jgi:hypothetical protein
VRGPLSVRRSLASALLGLGLSVQCSSPLAAAESAPAARAFRRVVIGDSYTATAVRAALEGAAQRLEEPQCHAVFSTSEFQDGAGRPLHEKLTALSTDGPRYLGLLLFVDGQATRPCQAAQTLAYTEPGSRVVFVCGRRFQEAWKRNPGFAEAAIIHEALHTLGLGENPPSPQAITATVQSHCGR